MTHGARTIRLQYTGGCLTIHRFNCMRTCNRETVHVYRCIWMHNSLFLPTSSACLARISGSSPSWVWNRLSSFSWRICSRLRSLFSFFRSLSSLLVSIREFSNFLMACRFADSSRSRGENIKLCFTGLFISEAALPLPSSHSSVIVAHKHTRSLRW